MADLRVATVKSGRMRVPQQVLDELKIADGDQVAFVREAEPTSGFRIVFVPVRQLRIAAERRR